MFLFISSQFHLSEVSGSCEGLQPSGELMQHGGVNISTTLLGRHQCHHKNVNHMYLLNKVDTSRLGAVEVCVYVTDQAPPCDSDVSPPSEKRVTQDTRTKTYNLVLGLLVSLYLSYYYH